jgi:phenylalanyl-tRNA synthetase beta chain
VALAGVMGGGDSEISSSTRAVLLESAWFDPLSIRRTAKSQGLHTEASHRFERGADIEMAAVAIDRAASLILQVAGGEARRGIVDAYPRPQVRESIVLRRGQVFRVLGAEVGAEDIERILKSLGFEMQRARSGSWRVSPPTFRLDVTREVDLVEEIARHYGYDRLPARLRTAPPHVERDAGREKELAISSRLVALGYREIIPSSMLDPEENRRFTDRPPVVLGNPLSQEASALRSTTVPSMLHALGWNLDRGQSDLRLFEMGRTYSPQPEGLADERRVLTLGLTGSRQPVAVYEGEKEKEITFYDFRGDIENLFEAHALPDLKFVAESCRHYEPGQSGRFVAGESVVAVFGQLRSDLARDYKLRQPVWVAEIDLDALLGVPARTFSFRAFSKFPAVERDFSLVVPEQRTYREIEEAVRGLKLEELQALEPLEVFRGGNVAAGFYSLLLRAAFQSASRTLTSDEASAMGQGIVAALETLGIRLRA